jgi:hypothetical protein
MPWAALCAYCGRCIAVAPLIGDDEAEKMRLHLQTAHPTVYKDTVARFVPAEIPFSEILWHFRITQHV